MIWTPAARLSEKSLELNFCAQLRHHLGRPILWFGLTQRQERRLGFDAATHIPGKQFLFQFKASNRKIKKGTIRHFRAGHKQWTALRAHTAPGAHVFYVLPDLGNLIELVTAAGDVLHESYLVDVRAMPPLAVPARAGGYHLLDLDVGSLTATFRSEPVQVAAPSALSVLADVAGAPGETEHTFTTNRELERLVEAGVRNLALAIVPN